MITRSLFVSGILLLLSKVIMAQSPDPYVIGTAGEVDKTEHISLEWTIGETFVNSYSDDGLMVTEGYHQPLIIERLIEEPIVGFTINVFPNPVSSILNIFIASEVDEKVLIRIIDMDGRLIYSVEVNSHLFSDEFDMSSYGNGLYLLTAKSTSGNINETYKIFKSL